MEKSKLREIMLKYNLKKTYVEWHSSYISREYYHPS